MGVSKHGYCKIMISFFVYILQCNDGLYYVGHTADIEQRLDLHALAKISYVSQRLPFKLVYQEEFMTRAEAFAMEQRLKGWGRRKKEALIVGDFEKLMVLSKKNFIK